MSRVCREEMQSGYLVDALEPVMAMGTRTLGAGPFFVTPPFAGLRRAEPTDTISQVALAHSSNSHVELVEPVLRGRRVMHYVGMENERFDRQREAALDVDMVMATERAWQRKRFACVPTGRARANRRTCR
jgi:hypothetical protein